MSNTPTAVVKRATEKEPQVARLKQLLERVKPQINDVIASHLSADKIAKLALVAASRQPKLYDCTPASIAQTVMSAAQLGLDLSGITGQAYMVPFNNKNRMECQLIIGYRGLLELVRRTGEVKSVEARVVFDCDTFEWECGLEPKLRHLPNADALCELDEAERVSRIRYVYAIARMSGDSHHYEVMSVAEINRIMAMSKSAKFGGPWKDHYEEMAKKTVIRRLVKYLPISVEKAEDIHTALEKDTDIDLMQLREARAKAALPAPTNGLQLPDETDPHTPEASADEPQPEPEPQDQADEPQAEGKTEELDLAEYKNVEDFVEQEAFRQSYPADKWAGYLKVAMPPEQWRKLGPDGRASKWQKWQKDGFPFPKT